MKLILNTIICLVHKINRNLPHDHAKISDIYHGYGISHHLLQKFKIGILRYFEIRFAPFLLIRGQEKWITQSNASGLRLQSTRSFLIKAQAETKAKKKETNKNRNKWDR